MIKAVADGRVLLDERTLTRRRVDHEDPTADLTPSERKVLDLIGDGLSNREIGEKLGVAEKTCEEPHHLSPVEDGPAAPHAGGRVGGRAEGGVLA